MQLSSDEKLMLRLDDLLLELTSIRQEIDPERSRDHSLAFEQLLQATDRIESAMVTLDYIFDNADKR